MTTKYYRIEFELFLDNDMDKADIFNKIFTEVEEMDLKKGRIKINEISFEEMNRKEVKLCAG